MVRDLPEENEEVVDDSPPAASFNSSNLSMLRRSPSDAASVENEEADLVDDQPGEGDDEDALQQTLLASFSSVFTLFREVNPYLKSGFRRPSVCWRSALRSVTQIHNETVNIWVHLLAGLYHTALLLSERFHPMMAAAIGCGAMCFFLSAGYHTFRFMSPGAFQWWLKIDHLGCVVFIAGSNLTWLQIIFACQSDLRRFYSSFVLLCATLTVVVPILPIKARVRLAAALGYKLYDLAEPFLVLTAFASTLGVAHHLYLRGVDTIGRHLFLESVLYILGFAIFLTKVPERLVPRCFDVWGNSHQLWHVCIVLSDLWHIRCVRYYSWHWNPDC